MAKKSKKSVVWIWREGWYLIGKRKPKWSGGVWSGFGSHSIGSCESTFNRFFPFFKMPPNSLGKITNTANTLTFEIVETKGDRND